RSFSTARSQSARATSSVSDEGAEYSSHPPYSERQGEVIMELASLNAQIRRRGYGLFALFLLSPGNAGCHQAQSVPTTPTGMLKWSMTKYAALTTLQAKCLWSATFGGQPSGPATKRTLWYEKPNRFKVVSSHDMTKMVQTSVSDGTKLVEFTTGVDLP